MTVRQIFECQALGGEQVHVFGEQQDDGAVVIRVTVACGQVVCRLTGDSTAILGHMFQGLAPAAPLDKLMAELGRLNDGLEVIANRRAGPDVPSHVLAEQLLDGAEIS